MNEGEKLICLSRVIHGVRIEATLLFCKENIAILNVNTCSNFFSKTGFSIKCAGFGGGGGGGRQPGQGGRPGSTSQPFTTGGP